VKLPTENHISAMFDRLRRHGRHRRPEDHGTLATWAELEHALLSALRRARSGSVAQDATGAPATDVANAAPNGFGTGSGSIIVPDEDGHPDAVPATAVEIRALDRVDDAYADRQRVDPIDHDVLAAYEHLVEAVNHLGALQTRLSLIARKANPLSRSEAGGAGACEACGTIVTGAAEDRLKRGLGPCCYSAWRHAGRPHLTEFKRIRANSAPPL